MKKPVLVSLRITDPVLCEMIRRESATLKKPISHLVRDLVADFYSYFDAPQPMTLALEEDRADRHVTLRDHFRDILGLHYQRLLAEKLPPSR